MVGNNTCETCLCWVEKTDYHFHKVKHNVSRIRIFVINQTTYNEPQKKLCDFKLISHIKFTIRGFYFLLKNICMSYHFYKDYNLL